MQSCELIKHYTEPTHKYICLSTSLFIQSKYIKAISNIRSTTAGNKNVTDAKLNLFYKNLLSIAKNLIDGTYPKNYYLRIYYDSTLFNNVKFTKMIKLFKTHPKIQLVEYSCNKYKSINNNNNSNIHINLFGTLMRFYSIFDPESPNMKCCICIDADNTYTKQFINIISKFYKSDKLVYAINRINQISFHADDYITETPNMFNFTYLLAGAIAIKRNDIFNISYWNKYFDNMFMQNDLLYKYNYLDFKRFGINHVTDNNLNTNSYYSFHYGTDEIWINYVIKKILIDNNSQHLLDCYIVNDYSLQILLKLFNKMLLYNNNINPFQFNLFLSNCNFIPNKSLNSLTKYILNTNKNEIHALFKLIIDNPYFNNIYLPSNLKYIIINFNTLIRMRGKYSYNQLTYSI
jgi:hypothetical protein